MKYKHTYAEDFCSKILKRQVKACTSKYIRNLVQLRVII